MATKTQISNMAISHLGVGKEISNLDTERSEEAAACRRFYDVARDDVLREYPWSFATVIQPLALIEDLSTDDTEEYNFSYRYPADCIQLVRIKSGDRNDSHQSRVRYQIIQNPAGKIILTDYSLAEAEYIQRVDNPSFYSAGFTLALSYKLAELIAPRLSQGDPFGARQAAMQMYEQQISKVKADTANQMQPDVLPESEFVRGRV